MKVNVSDNDGTNHKIDRIEKNWKNWQELKRIEKWKRIEKKCNENAWIINSFESNESNEWKLPF